MKRFVCVFFPMAMFFTEGISAKTYNFTVSSVEDWYDCRSKINSDVSDYSSITEEKICEIEFNLDEISYTGVPFFDIWSDCAKSDLLKLKIKGPVEQHVKFNISSNVIMRGNIEFENIDFVFNINKTYKIEFSNEDPYDISFSHCNFINGNFYQYGSGSNNNCRDKKSISFEWCEIENRTKNIGSYPNSIPTIKKMEHCIVHNQSIRLGSDSNNDNKFYNVKVSASDNVNINNSKFYGKSVLNGGNPYGNNNYFYEDSYPKEYPQERYFVGKFIGEKFVCFSNNLRAHAHVEGFLSNSEGFAVKKLFEGDADENGVVTIDADLSSVSEKIDHITLLVSKNSDFDNTTGMINFCTCIIVEDFNFYVKKTGYGNGFSWSDAMNELTFVSSAHNCPNGSTFHIAAGEYSKEIIEQKGVKFSHILNGVNFIGGYSANPVVGELSNVKKNKTVLKGNGYVFFSLRQDKLSEMSFSKLYFEDSHIDMYTPVAGDYFPIKRMEIDSCIFSKTIPTTKLISINAEEILIKNSFVDRTLANSNILSVDGKHVFIDGCTFIGGGSLSLGSKESSVKMINSTIVSTNNSYVLSFSNSNVELKNNTILRNCSKTSDFAFFSNNTNENSKFIGNIFYDNGNNGLGLPESCYTKYNVLSTYNIKDNISFKNENISLLLEGTFDDEYSLFLPDLTVKDGGFVPTIALKNDKLPDGTPIRFPRLSEVTKDANGVTRLSNTCPGAVEFPKKEVFEFESITFGENPECVVADRAPRITVDNGVSPYTFVIKTTNGVVVQSYMDAGTSHYMDALADGEYVAVITDGQNNVVTSDPFTVTSRHEVSATVSKLCDGTKSHIVLNYGGSVKKVELRELRGSYFDVTTLYDSQTKSVTVNNSYTGVRLTFDDGDGGICQTYTDLEEITEKPLQIAFATAPKICVSKDLGTYTCYPASQINLRGYKMYLVVTNKTTSKTYMDSVTQSGSRMSVDKLPVGSYEAYIALGYNKCIVEESKKNLDDFSIKSIAEPKLIDENSDPIIRCQGATMTQEISVTNYSKDLYTWKLVNGTEDISSDVNVIVPTTSDGSFVFKGLSSGVYAFSLSDQCANTYTIDFEIYESLKKKIEIASTNSRGISCDGKSDAMLIVTMTNWNYGDKAVLTNLETGEKITGPSSKGGLASFDKYNLAGGKYSVEVTDLCGNIYPTVEVDLNELSKASKFGISLAEAAADAGCDADSRKISAVVSGTESGPYSYTLYKVEGDKETAVDTKTEVTAGTYTSDKLDYGTYKLVAVNANECEVSVERAFSASHALSGTRVVCGTNTHVELNYDGVVEGVSVKVGGKWADVKFAEGANKSIFDYSGVVTDVRVNENGCATDAVLSDMDLTDLFKGVSASAVPVNQTCSGVDNGSIKVTYSGYKGNMQVVAYAFDVAGKKKGTYDANKKSLINLPPGTYEVKLGLEINGCEVADKYHIVEDGIVVKALEKPVLSDNNDKLTIRCEGKTVTETIGVTNYNKDLYTWKLTKDEKDITSEVKPTITAGEKTTFKFADLEAATYVFSLADACESYPFKFIVKENIKKPLVFSEHHKGISCEGKSDGQVAFSITNWSSTEDQAVLTNLTTKEEVEVQPFVKGSPAVASWTIPNVSGGKYSLAITEYCGTEFEDQIVDIDELSKTSKFGISLAEAAADAGCDADSRKISAVVSGTESGPYSYTLYKVEGEKETAVDTKTEVTAGTYTSDKLDYGTYKLVAVNANECEVSVERAFSASHTLSGTRVVCGTNTHVELNYDGVVEGVSVKVGGKWADVKFVEGANKSIFDYSGVVTDVRVKESGCATDAALSDAKLADDLFAGVNASAVAVNQTCYGVDNGSIKVTYSGYKGNMQVVAYAFDAAGKKKGTYDANKKSLINLPPGTYEVKLGLEINGCEVAGASKSVKTGLKIEGLEKPEFLEDNFSIVPNRCEGQGKGRMHLEMKGWKDGIYKWTLQRAGLSETDLEVYTHCGAKLENGATAFDLWSLPEGKNVFTMWDACDYKYTKTADIKADYIAPLTLDTCNSKAYTCADRTDGSLTFVASPWDVEDKAVLKKGSVVIDNVKPVVKEGKAYFALANQGAGTYSIATTDLCARTDDKSIDFTAFSEKNGLLTVSAEIDKDAAVCEIGKRVIKVTANGGTSPYVYSVTKTDGTAVETSEALEEKTFSSQLVSAGKYKVSVTDNTECTAVYDGDLTVASETLNVKLDKYASNDQTCYGKNNAVVSVAYTGFNTELAKLRLVVTEKTEAKKKKSYEVYAETNEGTLELKTLPTGSYDVKVELVGLNGCEMNNGVLLEKEEELKPLEKPEFLEDNFSIVPNHCEGQGKGRMHLEMKGWKDGIYKWTLQRAGQTADEIDVNTHCGDKLSNGATAFDLWSLPEGKNVFTMWDACDYKYTKTADIKADYIAPLTLDTCNSKAYTCADRADGSLTFVASPWDVEDKAVLKKGSVVIDNVKPVVKEGKAYFALANQGAGTYSIATTDLCARTDDKSIDFTAFSEKNGMLVVDVDFDAEAAKCDVDKRVFNITAKGGTAPYVYAVTKTDGTAVETSEAREATSYNSQLLADGQYKVTVTDNTECTAVYGGDLSIDPAHTMKALMREVVCDDHKNVAIVADVDNNTIIGTDYVATDAAGNVYKPLNTGIYKLFQLVGITYYQIPADVTLNGISAKVDEDCRVYSDLAELPFDKSALEKAVVTVDKVIDQRCYNVNNGELDINYSGPETSYTVAMRLKRVTEESEDADEEDTEIQKGTDLKFKFENLAPGEYELYLVHKVGDCDAGIKPRLIQNVTIKPMPHKFERIAGDTTIQSTCYSSMNAIASIKVHGWCPEYCTWELFKDGVSLGHNTDAAPVKGDTAVWGGSELKAGAYEIKWTNYCKTTVSKKFTIDPLNEPKITMLSSSYTDLKCEYDKAYIDFHYEGGSIVNKRILFIDNGDWEYTVEPLKAENTYRYYGHTLGSGLQGHKKAEGTSYVLTDEDKGLNDGSYTIIFQDTTKQCASDSRSFDVKVNRPYVKLNLAKQDVLCYSENYGVINMVPTRTGKNAVSYKYMDQYPNRSDIRDQGINFGEEIFKDPSIQAEKFSDRNKFLSDVFSDVESISITCKKMTKDELYKLMQDSIAKRKTNLKYPLPKFYKDGGYEYAVSDWIGFNMMPVDMYYVTVNDIYGCHYTDSIEVKGPEDGLRVTGAKYPMGENPECNAENRRIQFTCTGGYYPYYYNVVNLDDPVTDEHSTAGSGLSAADYVTGAVTEKYLVNDKQYIDYTSKMLKPGRYEVSVMDTMGCIAKWEQVINVDAKHVLDATPHVDVCDPANDNKLEILSSSGNASSYTLYIGHRTHCVYYPYCTVDDDNSGLVENNGKKQHIHKCEADLYKECEHFTNCLEKKAGITASNIKFKDFENNKWVAKSGYGLSGIPSGTIGVLATYSDGCTAFDEYTFKSSGLPTSVMPVAMDSVRCNGDETGAITFGLFGGHGAYKKMTLDGQDISDKTLIMFTRHEDKVNSKINYTENKIDLPVNMLLNNKSLFETLKKYYDGDALYKEAVALLGEDAAFSEISKKVSELKSEYGKTTYSFRLDNLQGTVNWNDLEKNKKHVLTVVDEQECEASMEFDIYQPTKLNITVGASVICPDGSGRIFASSTSGGVPPYEYRMNEAEPGDYEAVFNSKIGKMPKTYEGEELVHPEDYYNYYVKEYHKGDHIPAGRGVPHYMLVKDANECEMISADPAILSEIWAWDKVQQDQLISTWHDYGDVLVVTDQTDYSMVHPDAVYDSMKVIIVMDDEGAGKFEGVMQPKEVYTYGVKNGNKVKTDFGSYTSSWGIPPLALEKYNEYLADESKHLEPIHTYFEKLVSDDAQRRMTFVKFQTPEGVDVKLADMIGNKEDYHLNFLVRVVAYVGGCDIVTEHNPLVLNLKGEDPFPDATYKSFISVDAFPNPVAKDGKCTMKVTLTNEDNEFTYSLFTLDGRRLYTKTVYPSSEHTKVEKEDGNTDYIYEVEVKGITETSIVKVTSETNTAVVKILAK